MVLLKISFRLPNLFEKVGIIFSPLRVDILVQINIIPKKVELKQNNKLFIMNIFYLSTNELIIPSKDS